MNPYELTGRARTHLTGLVAPACTLHMHAAAPFARLRDAARAAGFELVPSSAFRDFDRQLSIWNAKFRGDRPLLDATGQALDAAVLSPAERVAAILVWSALPGASRHHWGTDLDLFDANAVPAGYRVQLTAAEYAAGGPFHAASLWLEANAARFGFFRPFRGVRSGVQSEPWHFSFAPVAEAARRALTWGVLEDALADVPLLGLDQVMARLEELHARYVAAIDWP
jgi:LAS superfamily LD-carboxypeptidase LdcB